MTAEQMELRRVCDKAAAEARAQARAAAAAAPTQQADTHYSDAYTAGWERRLSAFDSDLQSLSKRLRHLHQPKLLVEELIAGRLCTAAELNHASCRLYPGL